MDTDETQTERSAAFRPLRRTNACSNRTVKRAEARAPFTFVSIRVHPWLINSEVVHHHAPPHATKRFRIRHAFTRRRGDGVTQVAFAAETEARHARAVL